MLKITKKEKRIISEFHDLISSNNMSEKLMQAMNLTLKSTYDEVKHLLKVVEKQ
jgi:hypothetical protein